MLMVKDDDESFLKMQLLPKLCDFPMGIIIRADRFAGGDKPHPYLSVRHSL